MKQLWYGETTCDFCHHECKKELIDGKTTFGPWATMCPDCFEKYGIKLGTGFGQKYKRMKNDFEKVEG